MYEYDPVLGDTYGYPTLEFMKKGWIRYSVGWALLGLDEDEPAMYFDYYFSEDEWFLNLDEPYCEAYIFKDKIGFGFVWWPYYEEFPISIERVCVSNALDSLFKENDQGSGEKTQ